MISPWPFSLRYNYPFTHFQRAHPSGSHTHTSAVKLESFPIMKHSQFSCFDKICTSFLLLMLIL